MTTFQFIGTATKPHRTAHFVNLIMTSTVFSLVFLSVPVEVNIYETDMEVETGQQVIMTCIIQGAPLKGFYWVFIYMFP